MLEVFIAFWVIFIVVLSPLLMFVPMFKPFVDKLLTAFAILVLLGAAWAASMIGFVFLIHFISCTTNC